MYKIIIKKADEPAQVREMETIELSDMQEMVGGYIELLDFGNGVDLWLNEEGKLAHLPINFVIGDDSNLVVDFICGDVFFAGHTDEGDTVGLTDEQERWVLDHVDSPVGLIDTESGNVYPWVAWEPNGML